MSDIRVQDEQGTIHVFPDGSTPEMISQAMGVKPPDSSVAEKPEQQGPVSKFASEVWKQVSPVAGFKGMAQITRHPIETLKGDAAARTEVYKNAEEAFKKKNYTEAAAHLLYAALPFFGPQMDESANDFKGGEYAKGIGRSVGMGIAMSAPGFIKESGVVSKIKSAASSALEAGKSRIVSNALGRAATQTLEPGLVDAPVSITRGPSSAGPATAITHREVLQHATQEGIQLTPAQGLQTAAARSEHTFGEEAFGTGSKISESVGNSKIKLNESVGRFQDKLDPQKVGLSEEATGEHFQNSAEIAKSSMKDNVNNIYDQVKQQQADLAGDVQTPLRKFYESESHTRQPHAAVTQPVFKTAAARSALNDINEMLQDPALQGRASVESLRNLRSNLMEKGNDYGANALADSGQRIYKLAAGKVDDAIMDAAKGTQFEETFREASKQNKKLQELYNTRGSPLYRILNTADPAKITNEILNRSSVHDLEILKGENFDLGPLARQAVEDIKSSGYKVSSGGLGGYPDTFLRSLLGPDATKELYLKAEISRRLSENYNPSGSGKAVLGATQALHPVAALAAQAARLRSMPRSAESFLPKGSASLGEAMSPIKIEIKGDGIKWATDSNDVSVSIPKSVAEADVKAYARKKLAEQIDMRKKYK